MLLVEIGARDDVLVHADGPVDFAAAPVQGAERKVRVDGLVVELGEPKEHLERSIGLVIEQEPQAFQVTLAPAHAAPAAARLVPDVAAPADGERARQRQPEDACRRQATSGGRGSAVGAVGEPARFREPQRMAQTAALGEQPCDPVERQTAPASRPAENAIRSARPAETRTPNAMSTSNRCGLSAVNSSPSAAKATNADR